MNIDITIEANKMADFVLDFDACKSVVRAGNSGNYNLKPVVSVIPHYVSGVQGAVASSVAGPTTVVSLQQSGVVVKSTTPDATTGNFLLQPVAPGTYDLVLSAAGHAIEVITGVVVSTDTVTAVNGTLNPPNSSTGTALGAVTTATTPIDATVRAVQTLSGGSTIEVAGAAVDATTGAYSFTLPTAAPMVAPFAATLSFTANAAAAGKYTMAATEGVTTQTTPITLSAGATVTTDFTFP